MIAERVQKWIDGYIATGEARGEARGEAKATLQGQLHLIANICDMVTHHDLTRERAVARLQHLAEQRHITAEQAEQAIRSLR